MRDYICLVGRPASGSGPVVIHYSWRKVGIARVPAALSAVRARYGPTGFC